MNKFSIGFICGGWVIAGIATLLIYGVLQNTSRPPDATPKLFFGAAARYEDPADWGTSERNRSSRRIVWVVCRSNPNSDRKNPFPANWTHVKDRRFSPWNSIGFYESRCDVPTDAMEVIYGDMCHSGQAKNLSKHEDAWGLIVTGNDEQLSQ